MKSYFYSSVSRKECVLDLVHSDVCSMLTRSMGSALYFVLFVDDHSRKILVQLLRSKDEAFAVFKRFHAFVTTQTGRKLKCLRTDNGSEFTSSEFNKFCENLDIKRELTVPYSLSSNGVAERYNRHYVRG